MKQHSSIRSIVMRRVFYSYLVALVSNPAFLPGIFFGYSLMTFRELVFVSRVLEGLLSAPLGKVPAFILETFTHADVPSLLAFTVMIVSAFFLVRLLHSSATAPRFSHRLA